MMLRTLKIAITLILSLSLFACASTKTQSELGQGERLFKGGYYKGALKQLLPLAVKGNPKAQYAVGYMYFYGYGVAQDSDTGYFWINLAAKQHYQPAVKALEVANKKPIVRIHK